MLRCVEKAGDDIAKLERCEELGQTITSKVLHNRNFADSYADNLATRASTGERPGGSRMHREGGLRGRSR